MRVYRATLRVCTCISNIRCASGLQFVLQYLLKWNMVNSTVKHPYFPQDAYLPHYKPNVTSMAELLGIFFGLIAVLIVVLLVLTKRKSAGDKVKVCWFVSSGLIHIILEGYFSLYHATLAGEDTYLAQMCKSYIRTFRVSTFMPRCINVQLIYNFINT